MKIFCILLFVLQQRESMSKRSYGFDDHVCKSLDKGDCNKEQIRSLCPQLCSTDRMTIKGNRCVFPFSHRGVKYNNCATGVTQASPWCATSTKDDHGNTVKDWEVCASDQKHETDCGLSKFCTESMQKEIIENKKEINKLHQVIEHLSKDVRDLSDDVKYIKNIIQNLNTSKIVTLTKIEESQSSNIATPAAISSRNCADFYKAGSRTTGIMQTIPYSCCPEEIEDVFCNQEDGGGWTVIQRRQDVEPRENFTRPWDDYVNGFGNLDTEFWAGLKLMHELSTQSKQELYILLEDWEGETRWAKYDYFSVGSPGEKYKLNVKGYSGDAGDALLIVGKISGKDVVTHDGSSFSTYDQDNDLHDSFHCAKGWASGWWMSKCLEANLNGVHIKEHITISTLTEGSGILWTTWKGMYSLRSTTMKTRPVK